MKMFRIEGLIGTVLILSLNQVNFINGEGAPKSKASLNPLATHRACYKEVPAKFLFEKHFQIPEGNGSNIHFVKLVVCCEGYVPYEHVKNKCVPDCGHKCKNGICISPGVCECFPGFVKNLDNECVQTCPLSCINGKCHSNGTCICPEGFKLDETKKFCQPICSSRCDQNQNCTAPNHCSCLSGFRMNNFGKCDFYCEKDCIHGNCIGPNLCKCNSGYQLKNEICQANCIQRCDNGICVATDRCLCNPGFLYDYQTTICLPECKKCVNGVCVAPGCCKCFKDFRKVNGICTHKRKIK